MSRKLGPLAALAMVALIIVGLFDAADGRVQVEGDLREGDPVVVPSL